MLCPMSLRHRSTFQKMTSKKCKAHLVSVGTAWLWTLTDSPVIMCAAVYNVLCIAVKAIVQIRNVSKLYAHLHRVIRVSPHIHTCSPHTPSSQLSQTTCDTSLYLYESGFLLNDFLWAVSAVMSRQNEIPGKADGSGSVLALIPLWDLCNHTEGHMTTFYNLEERSCDCYALQDTPTGVEFKIFYGPRANYDLLTHQGFVYMENKSDSIQIRLGKV